MSASKKKQARWGSNSESDPTVDCIAICSARLVSRADAFDQGRKVLLRGR